MDKGLLKSRKSRAFETRLLLPRIAARAGNERTGQSIRIVGYVVRDRSILCAVMRSARSL